MSTLIERCDELSAKCDRLAAVNEDAELTSQIEAIEAKVTLRVEISGERLQNLITLSKGGLCDGVQWNLSSKFKELSTRLMKTLEKAREAPGKLKDDQAFAKCERLAKDLEGDLNLVLLGQWRDFVVLKTQKRIEIFSVVGGLSNCQAAVAKLKKLELQASNRLENLPASADDIKFISVSNIQQVLKIVFV